jgi:hypothetical protein
MVAPGSNALESRFAVSFRTVPSANEKQAGKVQLPTCVE